MSRQDTAPDARGERSADFVDGTGEAPTLNACGARIARLAQDEVVVKRGLAEVRLTAEGIADLLTRLLHLADGTRSRAEIEQAFVERGDDAERLVTALLRRGILLSKAANTPAERFWASVSPTAPNAPERVARSTVHVTGNGVLADAVRRTLVADGVGRVLDTEPEDEQACMLWCAADEVHAEHRLLTTARAALERDLIFLPVWIDDLVTRVGPMTFPYDTACLHCYLWRLESNDTWRTAHRLLRRADAIVDSVAGYLPSMVNLAAAVATGEIVKHLAGLPVTVTGRVAEISTVPLAITTRRVLKVPRCPECSGTAHRGAPVLTLGSQLGESGP